MTKTNDNFFDSIAVPSYLEKEYQLYEAMSVEQQAHAGRIGAKLWAKCDTLSPAGAFELTMAILNWAEREEQHG